MIGQASGSSLWPRVLASAVLIPAALGAVYVGGWVLAVWTAAAGLAMAREWVRIVHREPLGWRFALFVPRAEASGRTLILATDTGITAALGLVRATRFAPLLPQAVLIWLRASAEYFLPEEFVRNQIPAACGEVRIAAIPEVGHQDRIPQARAILREVQLRGDLGQTFIVGDGAVNQVLFDDLVIAGVAVEKDQVESFFNMPKKST